MAKTKFVLEADQAKAVSAFLKVVEAQDKTARGLKNINREGKKTKQTLGGFGKVASDVGKMAAGFLTAQGAIAGVRKIMQLLIAEFEDLKRKQEDAARATMDYAEQITAAVPRWKGAALTHEASTALRKLDLPQVGPKERAMLLGAWGGAAPGTGLKEGYEAVKLAGALTAENRIGFIKFLGELKEIYPKKEMEDLADIAIQMRTDAGKRIEELESGMRSVHRLVSVGIPREEALGALMAAFGAEQAGRAVGTLATLPSYFGQKVTIARGKRPTEEQRIQLETAGMTEAEIFAWVQANPKKAEEILKTTWPTMAAVMKPGAIAAQKEITRKAQVEDVYRKELAAEKLQPEIELIATGRVHKTALELQRMGFGKGAIAGMVLQRAEEFLPTLTGIGATRRKIMLAELQIKGLYGDDYLDPAIKIFRAEQRRLGQPTVGIPPAPIGMGYAAPRDVLNPDYLPREAEAIEQFITNIIRAADAMERMNAAMESMNANMGMGSLHAGDVD